jgi:GT2 family glycosyltransferase/tetratricopeptide (TPR) repeat protein
MANNSTTTDTSDALIGRADALRDAGRWAEAAEIYQSALERSPRRAAIWVQLGHARKEAGDMAGAEAAYRRSLDLAPNVADTYLQLGHVLKLQGQRPEAVSAYARALRVDRSLTPALTELIALGEAWAAEQVSGIGLHLLGGMLRAVDELRGSLDRLERALPQVASLNSFPPADYDLFRARYRLPPAPLENVPAPRWAVLALDTDGMGDPVALARSLAAQDPAPASVTVASSRPGVEAELRQISFGGLKDPIRVIAPDTAFAPPSCDWVLVIDARSILVAGAIGWLSWASSQVGASAIYADEDHLRAVDVDIPVAERPVLKAAYDVEAAVQPYRHGMVALRGAVAARVLPGLTKSSDAIDDLVDAVAGEDTVAHLPRILSTRLADLPGPSPRALRTTGAESQARIGVIMPTRNGADLCRSGIDALRRTASEPLSLDIVVIDNGSDDAATLEFLAELEAGGTARVLRDAAEFNWSRLSNAGAAACAADLLLFVNDDVEVVSQGWDSLLRHHLDRPEIGAVGARLLYPDGGVQHGGMVFGPGGRVEHEGVAPVGVSADIIARWTTRRRVGAVTGAFLACRREDFTALGSFDAAHLPIWFNDVDFCLRLRRAGRLILYAPEIVATHYESRTLAAQPEDARRRAIWTESLAEMRRRWGRALETDPGFNPHFARTGRPFEAITEPPLDAVREHLVLSAQRNPWALG